MKFGYQTPLVFNSKVMSKQIRMLRFIRISTRFNVIVIALIGTLCSCEDYLKLNLATVDPGNGNGNSTGQICGSPTSCSITSTSNSSTYTIDINPGPYSRGDDFTIYMSGQYNFGQAKQVLLYCNEDQVHNFGSWLNFSSNVRTISIPYDVDDGYCYTIRVTKEGSSVSSGDDLLWVSPKFTIN